MRDSMSCSRHLRGDGPPPADRHIRPPPRQGVLDRDALGLDE
jgi:hypothetical protein